MEASFRNNGKIICHHLSPIINDLWQLEAAIRRHVDTACKDTRMDLLVTACEIHNGAGTQTDPPLGVCLDADRLDLGRVGITPDPTRLSTSTARDIAIRLAWHELESIVL
jgi:hypothetical protein